MSELPPTSQNTDPNGAERKKRALDWLLFNSGYARTGPIADPNAPENPEWVTKFIQMTSTLMNRTADYQRQQGANCYLKLAGVIGSTPTENPHISEILSKLKEQIKDKPEFLKVLKEQSDPRRLKDIEVTRMFFLDILQYSAAGAVARIYYPDRFEYLVDGLIETEELGIDEIYNSYLTLLQKCIDYGRSKGYSEIEKGGDSIGTYLEIYKKLTST